MDLWGQWVGKKDPTLIVLEGGQWRDVTVEKKLARALEKRAEREKWDDVSEGHEFYALIVRRASSMMAPTPDLLDVDVCGVTVMTLTIDEVEDVLEQMRVSDATATAAPARAVRDAEGIWLLSVCV